MRRVGVRVLSLTLAAALVSTASAQGRLRKSVGLDRTGWFPADRDALRKDVNRYLKNAGDVKVEGKPVALIAPHAGYTYSGPAAGFAFKPIVGKQYKRVILLGPSHRAGFSGASIANVDAYGTPLGNVPLDRTSCLKLLACDVFKSHPTAHREEHSLQAELPFLQRALVDWKLVPVLIGPWQNDLSVGKIAEAIKPLLTDDTLVVVSSDFTHYGRGFRYTPFRTDLKSNIRKLDQGAIDRICANDCKGFRDYVAKTRITVCGREAISVMLKLFEGRKDVRGKLVKYANSGDRGNDYRHAVSYASIVITDVDATPLPARKVDLDPPRTDERTGVISAEKLTEKEQKVLLRMAREQLEKAVKERKGIDTKQYGWDLNKRLLARGGVFVTLKNKGRLRGCIGDIIPQQPLYASVVRNTVNAALYDPRFRRDRITKKELPEIHIEISYLTPMRKVNSITDIVVGRHGVLLEKGPRRAVFLPQVATEQGWDRETMLRHLAMKARLPADAWKEGCTFQVFEAQVFGEKAHAEPPERK